MNSCGESKEVMVVSQSGTAPVENCCFADMCKGGWGTGQEWGNLLPNFFSYKFRSVPVKCGETALDAIFEVASRKVTHTYEKCWVLLKKSRTDRSHHQFWVPIITRASSLLSDPLVFPRAPHSLLQLLFQNSPMLKPRTPSASPSVRWPKHIGAIRQECRRFHVGSQPLLSPLSLSSCFLSPHHCPSTCAISPIPPASWNHAFFLLSFSFSLTPTLSLQH